MTQPSIELSDGSTSLILDPDLQWVDEFEWSSVEQSAERGLTGALIVDVGIRLYGRPITLAPFDDESAWMTRATLTQLQNWESQPELKMTLSLRGTEYTVQFRRFDVAPIEARPVTFVADPEPGGIGDFYLVTIRLMTVSA